MANIIHKGDRLCAHIYTHSRYTESIVGDKFTKLSDIVSTLVIKNDIQEKDYKHHFIEQGELRLPINKQPKMKYTAIKFNHQLGQAVIRVYADGTATLNRKRYSSYKSARKALTNTYGFVYRID